MSEIKRWTLLSLLSPEFIENIQFCVVFGSAGCEALIVTKSDELYGLGFNACSCLGTCFVPSFEPVKLEALCSRGLISIAVGSGPHCVALSATGELYAWGHNGYGQLGLGHTSQSHAPVLVTGVLSGEKIVQIACGGHHTVALSDRGEVYAWGLNSSGQLGIGSVVNQDAPRQVLLHNRFIKAIAAGHNTTLALTESGDVYAWGFNGNGQVGTANLSNQHTPFFLENLSKNAIVCGHAHSLALSDEGTLYAWGSNSCGQLGGNLLRKNQLEPVQAAKDLGRIVEVAAIHLCNITVVATKNGKVYMWGNVRGQSMSQPVETRFTCVDEVFACFASPAVSWRPIEFGVIRRTTILDAIRVAFDDPTTSDLKISVDGHVIHAHKALLKMRCQYFRTRFSDRWSESNGSVEITQFSYPIFRSFLAWLYTDELNVELDDALGLLELAHCYCENGLKTRCAALLTKAVTVDNAALLYAAGVRFDAPELEDHCFHFCLNHMTAVIQSEAFLRVDETAIKTLMCRAAKAGIFKR